VNFTCNNAYGSGNKTTLNTNDWKTLT